MCEGAWGGGEVFEGLFFLNWGMISPLPACGLCAKEQERRQEIIFLKPSAPGCSIPAQCGCVHHRDPWVPKPSLTPSLCCRRTNLEPYVGISTEPCSPHPAGAKRGLIKHGMWEKNIPGTLVSLPSQCNGTYCKLVSFLSHFPYKTTLPWAILQLFCHSALSPLPSFMLHMSHTRCCCPFGFQGEGLCLPVAFRACSPAGLRIKLGLFQAASV